MANIKNNIIIIRHGHFCLSVLIRILFGYLAAAMVFCDCFIFALPANSTHIPDTIQCCRSKGVSELCVKKLCNVYKPPDEFEVFEVTNECPQSLADIAQCLADERDHMLCCKLQAKGIDDLTCLHLCNGSPAPNDLSRWEDYKSYVACLSFNIRNMYECFITGYKQNPDPPVDLVVIHAGKRKAEIMWKPPIKMPHLVHQYRVTVRDLAGELQSERVVVENLLKIEHLHPNTDYVVSVVAEGTNSASVSLPSNILRITTDGLAPEVHVYKEETAAIEGTTQTLVCKINIHGKRLGKPLVTWFRRWNSADRFEPIPLQGAHDAHRFQTDTFLSAEGPFGISYVSTLTIANIRSTDNAQYKCLAWTAHGEGFAEMRLRASHTVHIPDSPPNVTECCLRENVEEKCLSTCHGRTVNLDLNSLFAFEYQMQHCAMELPKMLRCGLGNSNHGACCLKHRVPDHCLSLCDGQLHMLSTFEMYSSCMSYFGSVMDCYMESKASVPSPPDGLKLISSNPTSSAIVQWNEVTGAKLYIVYYRQDHLRWDKITSTTNVIALNRLNYQSHYEVIVLAANVAGHSDASRSLFFDTYAEK
ncbi:Ig-like and fibronectin type-III domain-containing protein C25G4.10 [Trichinella zimbabwensis]|uniref:Ig-like and fibronectin type-III domain-containing protein C25G4.10 n=1 Tax=Trichinella zimbabwensis TaxID=268475 RepID=A0A0V1I7W0_9BILA|nr:Ig-like and fibronectin type-III domain-containing protein C25G4.10 [Trichinella zimbabwensis]